jgi:hypothetical protein
MKNLLLDENESEKFLNLFNIYLKRLKIQFFDENEHKIENESSEKQVV